MRDRASAGRSFWTDNAYVSRFLSTIALMGMSGCALAPQQAGELKQSLKPDGKAVVVAYVRTSINECDTASLVLARRSAEGLVPAGQMTKQANWFALDQLVVGQLAPGAYELVGLECTNKGAREQYYASKLPDRWTNRTYEKSLAIFSVGADEVLSIGGVEVRMSGPQQAAARPIPIPAARMEAWTKAHPEWAKKLVSRPLVGSNPNIDHGAGTAAINMLMSKSKTGAASKAQ